MLKDAMGGYRGTAIEISRVIAEHPGNTEAYYDLGNARSSCDDYDGAIDAFTMALKIGLRFREAIAGYGDRGIARVKSGDFEGAAEDRKRSTELAVGSEEGREIVLSSEC
jgi:tetratricopeptide (TPR) repeat protein